MQQPASRFLHLVALSACPLVLLTLILSACTSLSQPPAPPPGPSTMCIISPLETRAHMFRWNAQVTFENTSDRPLWFITRRSAEIPLNEDALFQPGRLLEPLQIERLIGLAPDGSLTEVLSLKYLSTKRREGGIRAVKVPAKSKLFFERWPLYVWENTAPAFEVIEADDLLVNGLTPIHAWLNRSFDSPGSLDIYNPADFDEDAGPPAKSDPRRARFLDFRAKMDDAWQRNPVKIPDGAISLQATGIFRRYTKPIENLDLPAPLVKPVDTSNINVEHDSPYVDYSERNSKLKK